MKLKNLALVTLCSISSLSYAIDDHLLLTEAVATPTANEFIEIANPTGSTIALDNYYLSDDEDYALLPGAFGAGPMPNIGSSDFIAQFPAGATIAPGQVVTIAFSGTGFATAYGMNADYEIFGNDATTTDMINTDGGATPGITNSGENVVLFIWDGATDLVTDVDMVNIGTPSGSNDIGNKTGVMVDGPDADMIASTYNNDALTMIDMASDPSSGSSAKRIALETGEEVAGGNGFTGDDETSENITNTWSEPHTAPDPGVFGALPEVDLSLVKVVDNTTPTIGDNVTYTLTVTNAGPDNATGVTVLDMLPAGLAYVSDDSMGAYIPGSGIWITGDIASMGTATLTIVATANQLGAITNVAEVETQGQPDLDSVPGNDTGNQSEDDEDNALITVAALPVVDLSLTKTADNLTPVLGDTITYTITVSNAGPDNATGVVVMDLLPAGLTYVSDDSVGAYVSGTGVWTVGAIANGASTSLSIMTTLTQVGSITNVAEITAQDQGDSDSTPGNDTGNQSEDDEDNVQISITYAQPTPVPTLGLWNLLIFALSLLMLGMVRIRANK